MRPFRSLRHATPLRYGCAQSTRPSLCRSGNTVRLNATRGTRFNTTARSRATPSQATPPRQASFGINASGFGATLVAFALGLGTASGLLSSPTAHDAASAAQGPRYADEATTLKAIDEIRAALGDDAVSVDPEDLDSHGYAEISSINIEKRPSAVIMPTSTEQVSIIARICSKYKVPMIPFGANSSVEGHTTAPFNGLSIDFSAMNKVLAFNEEDMDIVVQPGVNWVSMNEEIKESGLFLPVDPSPTALIGGMVATNCSGTNAMRYGSMKDWVVNLTVVLADGSVIKTRHRPRKTSAGYNLNGLFTGSEGTLGLITEITLKLAVVPSHYGVATAAFPSVKHAAQAASRLIRQGVSLAALELMDETQMRVINQTGGTGGRIWPERTMLFIKFSGSKNAVDESIEQTQSIAEKFEASDFSMATSKEEMENLWSARKQALWAMLAVRPEGTEIWSTDVAVPLSRLAEIMDDSKERTKDLGLFSSLLGHVGDGNFHQSVMYNPKDSKQRAAVHACVHGMVDQAVEMEGTVSGEHGIGLGKKECLLKELGVDTVRTMKTLKLSLDPHYLLNPGKIFD